METVRLALAGCGNVSKAFLELLLVKKNFLAEKYNLKFRITGVKTGRHGGFIAPGSVEPQLILDELSNTTTLDELGEMPSPTSTLEFIHNCPADVLLENTPVHHMSGQPATDHIRLALECGMHAVTANKGPVAHAYTDLKNLAKSRGKQFCFESTVMDGAPIFSLHRYTMPAAELRGFSGILNSCTNLLLEMMEKGSTLEEAVEYGSSIGITETDPSADIDGWDAAIKVVALANVLMNAGLKVDQVPRQGIRSVTPDMLKQALQEKKRWKLLCRAWREGAEVKCSVKPELVAANSPFYSVDGTSSIVIFETDVLPGLGVIESNPSPMTTAFGLLSDLIRIYRGQTL